MATETQPLLAPGEGAGGGANGGVDMHRSINLGEAELRDAAAGESVDEPPKKTKNQLGTINGVFVPCLLNILGAVLFMRIGYSVGYAGWFGTVLIFVFCESVTIMTALSFSAIVTNGDMAGGGAYYMISRSIGPAFGGATGFLFYFCYVINCAFNATAFVEDIMSTFFPHAPSAYTYYWYHGTMSLLLVVALIGAGAFAKVNTILFVCLFAAVLVTFGSMIFGSERHLETLPPEGPTSCHAMDPDLSGGLSVNYHPPRMSQFHDNFWWEWTSYNPLVVVLALLFTSTCGVMEGANLSGDLKSPAKSLPKGTLLAQCTSFTTYILFTTFLAMCFDRQTLRCEYLVLQKTAVSQYVVVIGIAMATLSTSLGALFGASRILQAIARDDIFPVSLFKQGSMRGDEPQYAVLVTFALAQAFVYLPTGPSVNAIGGVLTDFFLTAYAFVNLSQLLLCASRAPNYRPTFKWCPWWLSLIGFLTCYALMWFLQPVYAAITCGLWLVLFVYIKLTVGERRWGDIVQGVLYRVAVRWLTWLVPRKESAKFWRSNLLVLCRDTDMPMLELARLVTVNGMCVIGVPQLDWRDAPGHSGGARRRRWSTSDDEGTQRTLPRHIGRVMELKAAWLWLVEQANLDAFVQIGVGSDLRHIYTTLVSSSGLGGLVPNTVAMPYFEPLGSDAAGAGRDVDVARQINEQIVTDGTYISAAANTGLGLASAAEYVRLLQSVLDCEKNAMVVRNSRGLAKLLTCSADAPALIDVWIVGGWDDDTLEENVSILLQHAHLIRRNLGRAAKLRVIQLEQFTFPAEQAALQKRLAATVQEARVGEAEVVVVPVPDGTSVAVRPTWSMSIDHFQSVNSTMRTLSRDTAVALAALPLFPSDADAAAAERYVENLNALTADMPPLVLMIKGEPGEIISRHI